MDNLEGAFSSRAVMLQHGTLHARYQQVRTGYMLSIMVTKRSIRINHPVPLLLYDISIVLPSYSQNPVSSVSIVTRLHITRPSDRASIPN